MHRRPTSPEPVAVPGPNYPTTHDEPRSLSTEEAAIDDACQPAPTTLSDAEREAAIARAGTAMESAYADFKRTHQDADLDRAYRHMKQMFALVTGRSAAAVTRMETARGLRLPACANEEKAK